MSAPGVSPWTNSYLSFRLRPADEGRWIAQVEEALSPIVPTEPVASHMTRYNNRPPRASSLPWRDRNVLAAVAAAA